MAVQINVTGLVDVKVDTGSEGALESLGYSEDSIDVELVPFFHNVMGDQHGGREGPPIDRQYLGEIGRGRLVLSSYDPAVLAKVQGRLRGATAGTVSNIGALMIQGSKYFRLLLHSATDPINFPITFFSEPIVIPMGTKASILVIPFEAHRNKTTGVLYNSSTT